MYGNIWMRTLGIIFFIHAIASDGAMRTWTSTSGAQVEAELVSEERGTVSLRTPDGKELFIPLNQLSPEDQLVVQTAQTEAAVKVSLDIDGATIPDPHARQNSHNAHLTTGAQLGDRGLLPLPGPGNEVNHVVVDTPHYRAEVNLQGRMVIYTKSSGALWPTPLRFCNFNPVFSAGRRSHAREVIKFESSTAPAVNINQLTITGTYESNVVVTVHYDFKPDQVCVDLTMQEPSNQGHETTLNMGGSVPATMRFSNEVPLNQRKKALESYEMIRQTRGEKPETLHFWDSYSKLNRAESLVIRGAYGPRAIKLETKSRSPQYNLYVYPGKPMHDGFHWLQSTKRDGQISSCFSFAD